MRLYTLLALPTLGLLLACTKAPPSGTDPSSDECTLFQNTWGQPEPKLALENLSVYHIYTHRYSSNGTLEGVTDRLPALSSAGYNTIILSPWFSTIYGNASDNPYLTQSYYSIQSLQGDMNNVRHLVQEAHDLDMRIILDFPLYQVAQNHELYLSQPDLFIHDNYNDPLERSDPGFSQSVLLNWSTSDLFCEISKAMLHWVAQANIDGFYIENADGFNPLALPTLLTALDSATQRDLVYIADGNRRSHLADGFDLLLSPQTLVATTRANGIGGTEELEIMQQSLGDTVQNVLFGLIHPEMVQDKTPADIFSNGERALLLKVLACASFGVPYTLAGEELGQGPGNLHYIGTTALDFTQDTAYQEQFNSVMRVFSSHPTWRTGQTIFYHDSPFLCIEKHGLTDTLWAVGLKDFVPSDTLQLPQNLAYSTQINLLTGDTVTLGSTLILERFGYYLFKTL